MNIINWTLYLKFQSYTMKTIQLALLGMGLIFFNLKTLIFQSSFRITEELHRKYKDLVYTVCPLTSPPDTVFPLIRVLH